MSVVRVIFTVDDKRLAEFCRATYGVVAERPEFEFVGSGRVMPAQSAVSSEVAPKKAPKIKKKHGGTPTLYKNGKPEARITDVVETSVLLEKAREKAHEKTGNDKGTLRLKEFEAIVMDMGVSNKAAFYHIRKMLELRHISRTAHRGVYRIPGA